MSLGDFVCCIGFGGVMLGLAIVFGVVSAIRDRRYPGWPNEE